jgi:hypothetical protein
VAFPHYQGQTRDLKAQLNSIQWWRCSSIFWDKIIMPSRYTRQKFQVSHVIFILTTRWNFAKTFIIRQASLYIGKLLHATLISSYPNISIWPVSADCSYYSPMHWTTGDPRVRCCIYRINESSKHKWGNHFPCSKTELWCTKMKNMTNYVLCE